MKASELIEKLNAIVKKHGDLEVRVQYRDGGGCYYCSEKPEVEFIEKSSEFAKWLGVNTDAISL